MSFRASVYRSERRYGDNELTRNSLKSLRPDDWNISRETLFRDIIAVYYQKTRLDHFIGLFGFTHDFIVLMTDDGRFVRLDRWSTDDECSYFRTLEEAGGWTEKYFPTLDSGRGVPLKALEPLLSKMTRVKYSSRPYGCWWFADTIYNRLEYTFMKLRTRFIIEHIEASLKGGSVSSVSSVQDRKSWILDVSSYLNVDVPGPSAIPASSWPI